MNIFDIDQARSYATEENLKQALIKMKLYDFNPMIVCNRDGRFTAIFGVSFGPRGDVTYAARHGFKTLG